MKQTLMIKQIKDQNNMRKVFTLCFLLASIITKAQDLPTLPENAFAFPLGSKFTIKLCPVDSMNFDYSIIDFEQFDKIIDSRGKDSLFAEKGQDSTIAFYFCIGTHGENEKEKEDNMKVLLLLKNYSKIILEYKSEIQVQEDGEFETTSNIGCYPGALGTEIWPYMIYMIALSEFRQYQN